MSDIDRIFSFRGFTVMGPDMVRMVVKMGLPFLTAFQQEHWYARYVEAVPSMLISISYG